MLLALSDADSSSGSQPTRCTTSDVRIHLGYSTGATGHVLQGFRLRNVSASRCEIFGFPGITLITRSGRLLEHRAASRTHDWFGKVPKRHVEVSPGRFASFRLTADDAINGGNCPVAKRVRVIPPNDYYARTVTLPGFGMLACRHGVTVSPVAKGHTGEYGAPGQGP